MGMTETPKQYRKKLAKTLVDSCLASAKKGIDVDRMNADMGLAIAAQVLCDFRAYAEGLPIYPSDFLDFADERGIALGSPAKSWPSGDALAVAKFPDISAPMVGEDEPA
jgi:hypothetical protein